LKNRFDKNSGVTLFSILLISTLTFSLYFQLSTHEFLIIDDTLYVSDNQHVKTGLNLENILWAFTSLEAEFWHPLTWVSYMVDTQIYGTMPGGYLLTNLLLHILNSILLFYLIKLMSSRVWESFFIASLFALHPLHVEAVAWIAERKELLCALFWLTASIAYYFYTLKRCWQRYILVVILYLMGIMSKPMIITLPFTLLLLDFWPLQRLVNIRQLRDLVVEKIPLFVITAGGSIITLIAQNRGGGIVSIADHSLSSRVVNAVTSYAVYVKKTVWPESLSVFYPVADISTGIFLVSLVALLTISALLLFFALKYKFLLTGWLWFIGTLVPVIGIVKIGDFAMADRYTYISITGLFMIFVFGVGHFISESPFKKLWLILIPSVVLGSYIPNTFFQIQTWQNSKTLFTHSLEVTQDNFLAHHAMGEVLAGEGNMGEAAEHFSEAVRIKPDNALLWIKLGRSLAASEDEKWPDVDEPFIKAHELAPESPKPHFYLVCTLLAKGDIMGALRHFFMLSDKNGSLKEDREITILKHKVDDYYSSEENSENMDRNSKDITKNLNRVLARYGFVKSDKVLRRLVIRGYESWDMDL